MMTTHVDQFCHNFDYTSFFYHTFIYHYAVTAISLEWWCSAVHSNRRCHDNSSSTIALNSHYKHSVIESCSWVYDHKLQVRRGGLRWCVKVM